jgi:two-component sensor histidine kinase
MLASVSKTQNGTDLVTGCGEGSGARMTTLIAERRMEIVIPLQAGAAKRGRVFIENRLITLGYHNLVYVGALIASELVNNVAKHVPEASNCRLSLRNNKGQPLIEISDCSPRPPRLIDNSSLECGTGLRLVNDLSAAWGYYPKPNGKTIWVRLR